MFRAQDVPGNCVCILNRCLLCLADLLKGNLFSRPKKATHVSDLFLIVCFHKDERVIALGQFPKDFAFSLLAFAFFFLFFWPMSGIAKLVEFFVGVLEC